MQKPLDDPSSDPTSGNPEPPQIRIDVRLALIVLLVVLSTVSSIGSRKAQITSAIDHGLTRLHDIAFPKR